MGIVGIEYIGVGCQKISTKVKVKWKNRSSSTNLCVFCNYKWVILILRQSQADPPTPPRTPHENRRVLRLCLMSQQTLVLPLVAVGLINLYDCEECHSVLRLVGSLSIYYHRIQIAPCLLSRCGRETVRGYIMRWN